MTYSPQERKALIEQRLQALSPVFLQVIDESYQHVGHEGAKGGASHFAVIIVSEQFIDLPLIKRHQLIYALLKDLIPLEIHALKIKAKNPQEEFP